MTDLPKRFISSVKGKLYSSIKGKIVKQYLEEEALGDWAINTLGVDADAVFVEVVGAGHAGGTVAKEPFHLNIQVRDNQGNLIQTQNPHTKKLTSTWHAIINNVKSKKDLFERANARLKEIVGDQGKK